jgi:hypothetical protein
MENRLCNRPEPSDPLGTRLWPAPILAPSWTEPAWSYRKSRLGNAAIRQPAPGTDHVHHQIRHTRSDLREGRHQISLPMRRPPRRAEGPPGQRSGPGKRRLGGCDQGPTQGKRSALRLLQRGQLQPPGLAGAQGREPVQGIRRRRHYRTGGGSPIDTQGHRRHRQQRGAHQRFRGCQQDHAAPAAHVFIPRPPAAAPT